jgi:DNA-directed RNA polymerase subunit RPC12/RpoP
VTTRKNSVGMKCGASGADFYSYAADSSEVDGRVACPACGKRVKLRKVRTYITRWLIPAHNA